MSNDALTLFAGRLRDAGLLVETVIADGKRHECGTRNKPRSKNGRYICHLDAPASLWWMNHDEGDTGTMTATDTKTWTPEERAEYAARVKRERAEREAEEKRMRKDAARQAEAILKAAGPPQADFSYLARKGVEPYGEIRQGERHGKPCLILPVRQADGRLTSLQFIYADGTKRFLPGGEVKGGFFRIPADGMQDAPCYVCEGYATAASVHEAVWCEVLVAFDAGNLEPVARVARSKWPERKIIIAGDWDKPTKEALGAGGVGRAKAENAARAVGGHVVFPRRESMDALDWNDLHKVMGVDEVRTQILTAHEPSPLPVDAEAAKDSGKPVSDGAAKSPHGFRMRRTGKRPGLYMVKQTEKDGATVEDEIFICPPLEILGKTRDVDSVNWGKFIQWTDADGREHKWAMPASMLAGDGAKIAGALLGMGLELDPTQKRALLRFLSAVQTEKRVRCVARVGWHDATQGKPVYVLPDTVIGDAGPETVVLQTAHNVPLFSQRGGLAGRSRHSSYASATVG